MIFIEQKANHFDWVDYAKGIGIILVVYGHVARGVFNAGMIEGEELFKYVDKIIYSFHMPLFFFLSGVFFVQSFDKRGGRGLLINKLNSLVYPYLLWSLIQGGVAYSLQSVTNFKTSLSDIFSLLWLPQDQFWFLYALFFIFIFYTALYALRPNIFVLFLISIVTFFLKGTLHTEWVAINFLFAYGVYFCAGILLSRFKFHEINVRFYWVVIFIIAFVASQYYYLQLSISNANQEGFFRLIIAFLGIAFVVTISKLLSARFFMIKLIGNYSLEIYLLHVIIGSGFRIVIQHVFNIDESSIHLVLGTLVGVLASFVIAWYAKKTYFSFLFSFPKSKLINQ